LENNISVEEWNNFIEKILDENILKWKNEYSNNVLDGEEWELEMEFDNLQNFESYASNKYPRNWEKVNKIIFEYFPNWKEY